jgi:glucosamine--fructose-6-phosphate aminotransferase (isomerizing)
MCGIVGYIGKRQCIDVLYLGLQRLEYRGYDSAGIAVLAGKELGYVKAEGKLNNLKPLLSKLPAGATSGIGHTRWATHGIPNTINAHPHVNGNVGLIHNGIIENYAELKKDLESFGVKFKSQTDSEVVLELLVKELKDTTKPFEALKKVVKKLHGAFSLGLILGNEPEALYLVKLGSPLVIGAGQGENFFASDAMAILPYTNKALFLNDGEIARITENSIELWDFEGQHLPMRFTELDISNVNAEKQGYRHYMLKEIHEQPRVMANTIKRLIDFEKKTFDEAAIGVDKLDTGRIKNITMVACGTSYYSALLGKYFIEPMCGVPVNVELASEYRYRKPWLDSSTLMIAISQSGETFDTLACVKYAKEFGCQIMSVCNVQMSSIPRESTVTMHMDAGPEIGVASTKAFTSMLLCHYFFSMALAKKQGRLKENDLDVAIKALRELPPLMDKALGMAESIEHLASKYYEKSNFLFIGRGTSFPIALEGALKLKEISYIHAEGYAGGELKHGPIALIDRHMPVVALAPKDFYYEKMLSNIEEVKAREGRVICVGGEDDQRLRGLATDYIGCPHSDDPALQAILSVVPLQLLSYYVAIKRGTDVDQPRNLAKSVTVE